VPGLVRPSTENFLKTRASKKKQAYSHLPKFSGRLTQFDTLNRQMGTSTTTAKGIFTCVTIEIK